MNDKELFEALRRVVLPCVYSVRFPHVGKKNGLPWQSFERTGRVDDDKNIFEFFPNISSKGGDNKYARRSLELFHTIYGLTLEKAIEKWKMMFPFGTRVIVVLEGGWKIEVTLEEGWHAIAKV